MLFLKYLIDFALSLIILLLALPFLLIISVWLWIVLAESPLFFQLRVGKNGKVFRIVKLKTKGKGSNWEGCRLTGFLTRTHLDEIPQLFNVLSGTMSLVGPRPHVPEHVALYEPWQRERLKVKPGVTGLRQLKNPGVKMQFNEMIEDDILYIKQWSVGLDLTILLKTLLQILALAVGGIKRVK